MTIPLVSLWSIVYESSLDSREQTNRLREKSRALVHGRWKITDDTRAHIAVNLNQEQIIVWASSARDSNRLWPEVVNVIYKMLSCVSCLFLSARFSVYLLLRVAAKHQKKGKRKLRIVGRERPRCMRSMCREKVKWTDFNGASYL